jgi:hypothetical protein
MITPPIGLNLFVTSGITGMSLMQVVTAAAAVRRRAVLLPDPGDICPGAVDLAALQPDGTGDRDALAGRAPRHSFGRLSMMRFALPIERSMASGSTTCTVDDTPMLFLMSF